MACLPLGVTTLDAAYFALLPICLSDSELPETGLPPSVQAPVLRVAQLAADCTCHGVLGRAITQALDPRRAFADAVAQFSHD